MLTEKRELSADLDPNDRRALEGIVEGMEAGWNAGDGARFASDFAEDADFVTIRGEHLQGRRAIAEGHEGVFRTIYAGSTNRYTLEAARMVHPEVALVHVRAELDAPQGPLAGRSAARFSLVLTRVSGGWEIAALHNTLEAAQASRH